MDGAEDMAFANAAFVALGLDLGHTRADERAD